MKIGTHNEEDNEEDFFEVYVEFINNPDMNRLFKWVFIDEVWQPFLAAGMPVARSREIEESIGLLRPLATEALVAIFGERMRAQIGSAFGDRPSR